MYYPKSQIKPNLFTNGDQYVYLRDETNYIGFYYSTSDGRYFTGKSPNNGPNFELIPVPVNINFVEGLNTHVAGDHYVINDVYDYARGVDLTKGNIPPSNPISIFPTPTQEDYDNKEFVRYFLKRINQEKYMEVDQSTYISYKSKEPNVNFVLYQAFRLPLLISGKRAEVYNINRKTVIRVQNNLKFRSFIQYFKQRFDQLFRYTPEENLYTDGTEFKSASTGQLYRGFYHIHPEKGPMEGRQHQEIPHDFLIPISGSDREQIITRVEQESNNYRTSSRSSGGY